MRKLILFASMFVLLLGALALPARAQSPVTAVVDRDRLSTDEALLLNVAVDAAVGQPAAPVLPAMPDFEIVGSVSGTQVSLVNGDMQVSHTFQYSLRPLRHGTLTIDPISVQVAGQTYVTDPITVEVTQGTGQAQPAPAIPGMPNFPSLPGLPSLPGMLGSPGRSAPSGGQIDAPDALSGQDFFVEAVVDKTTPYQGEQVVYTFRFYQAVELFEQPDYEPPTFAGFWSETQSDQMEYATSAGGRDYLVTELKTVLFPTVVGDLTIDPARLTILGGFFSAGARLETQPLTLAVRPLPPGAPAGFSGAVGRFDIAADVNSVETAVNDTVTLGVTISGQGNLDALPEPTWTEGAEWRAFDSQSTVATRFVNGVLSGERRYERVLVPTAAGDLTLPPITYSFFDPQPGAYVTATTDPIVVQVAGADVAALVPAAGGVSAASIPGAAQIRPLKPAATEPSGSAPLTQSWGYWLLWGVPLLLLAGSAGVRQVRGRRAATAVTRRRQDAARIAKKALRQAKEQPQAAGAILHNYLGDRLGRPVAGLSHGSLTTLLAAAGADEMQTARVRSLLARSEAARYAPEGSGTAQDDFLEEASSLIDELDQVLEVQA